MSSHSVLGWQQWHSPGLEAGWAQIIWPAGDQSLPAGSRGRAPTGDLGSKLHDLHS